MFYKSMFYKSMFYKSMFYKSSPCFTSPVHVLQVQSIVYKSSPVQGPNHVYNMPKDASVSSHGESWPGGRDKHS
jgi:hypothetical protein